MGENKGEKNLNSKNAAFEAMPGVTRPPEDEEVGGGRI